MKEFNEYSEAELVDLIYELHLKKKLSIRAIARQLKTYPLKLCRFCAKHQIPVMSASESLKGGYENGTITNARKGVTLTDEEKLALSESQHQAWENMSDDERMQRSEMQREIFAKREDKATFHKKGARAIRRAADEGSKLEKFLMETFDTLDVDYIHHYKGMFGGSNLEADFFLPQFNTILEVDGPSHFASTFGVESYNKQVEADQKKNATVLAMGASIVRIKHTKTLYRRDYNLILESLLPILKQLDNELRIINVENL